MVRQHLRADTDEASSLHLQNMLVITVAEDDVLELDVKSARRQREVNCPWTVLCSTQMAGGCDDSHQAAA